MENVSIEIETNDLHAIQKSFKKWLDLLTWVFFVELLLKTLQFDNVRGFEYNTCILFFDRANTNSSIMFCMKAFEPEVTFCRKNSFVQEVDNHLDRDSDISNFRIENNVIFKKNIIFGSYLVKPVTFNDSKNILSTLSKGSITHRKNNTVFVN